jgi:hypothetical protein
MNVRRRGTIRSALILVGLGVVACGATPDTRVYDPGADFSLKANPNGVWEYGYSATPTLAVDQFRLNKAADESDPVGFWHPDVGQGGYSPYVACNMTTGARADKTKSWAVRAGEVAMEAAADGQYSIVRFTTPKAGDYRVRADFEGVHFHLSTTDVHVLCNGRSLFESLIDGYGGDPAFHKIEGKNPTASYSGLVHLEAGDKLSFAVGYGANKTHFNDTTGMMVHIERVK